MKPEVDQILGISAGQLMTSLIPLLPNSYAQGSSAVLSFMMLFAAQEYERGAEIRATDNAEMRMVFGLLAPIIDDAELKKKLEDAAISTDPSLLISKLNQSNAHLRALLIALHTYLESQGSDAARGGERRIWDVLKASAARRLLKPPGG
jgi:hypothetical protein